MPSAFIRAVRSYRAMPLARQLEHQRYVPPNPLVLGRKLLKSPAPTTDRDRPVSRRSKPSSRTAFIGEQPNPWELLHPQDAMHDHPRLSRGVDYITIQPDSSWSSASDSAGPDKILPVTISNVLGDHLAFRSSVVTGSKELVAHIWNHV